MRTKLFAEGTEVVRSNISINYNQDLGIDGQDLLVRTDAIGDDFCYTIITKGWTFDNVEEVTDILNDFIKMIKKEN